MMEPTVAIEEFTPATAEEALKLSARKVIALHVLPALIIADMLQSLHSDCQLDEPTKLIERAWEFGEVFAEVEEDKEIKEREFQQNIAENEAQDACYGYTIT